jgi:monoamine oxidase
MAALSRMIARAGGGEAPPAWDGESLGAWMAREVPDPELRAHVALHCELTFAVEPQELSLLDYLAQLGAADGWGDPFDADKGGKEHRFVPGAHALPQRLAAALGERVVLETPVRELRRDGDEVRVVTERETLRAAHVVLAIPPAAARRIRLEPALPAAAIAATAATRPGAVVKCIATYARPFWRAAGLSGEAYLSPGLVRATTDACSADGSIAALAIFVVAQQAASWGDAPVEERRARVCRELAILFGDEAASPRAFGFVDWRADPWAGGCVASMPPGARSGGAAWRGPFGGGRIHVAGTEAATRWPGFMEGAIEAGERAARAILAT